jgi:CBS domain-containing protein
MPRLRPTLRARNIKEISMTTLRANRVGPFWTRRSRLETNDNLAANRNSALERSAMDRGVLENRTPVTQGDKHELKVSDVMSTNIVSVAPDTPVREIATILARDRISSVPVINGAGRLIGM